MFADRAAKVAAALGRLSSEGRVKGGAVTLKPTGPVVSGKSGNNLAWACDGTLLSDIPVVLLMLDQPVQYFGI